MEIKTIKIDVVSDVACPWCYVGKRRLEEALKQWKGAPVEVKFHPFQLDPNMSPEGLDRDTYLTNKFGAIENLDEMTSNLKEAGKSVGIDFNFGDNWLAVNTLPLHQLLVIARQEGFDSRLKERFLEAYFEKESHLNDTKVLYSITNEFGWDSQKVDAILNDKNLEGAVQAEISHYQQRGVTGVPFFVINNEFGISGAQPVKVFLEAFQSVSNMEVSNGEACDPSGGCC